MTEQISKFQPEADELSEQFVDQILVELTAARTPEACGDILERIFSHTDHPIIYVLYLAGFVLYKHLACGAVSSSDNSKVIHAADHFKYQLTRADKNNPLVKKIIEYYNTQICTLVIKNVWMPVDYRQLKMWIVS